jgi:5-methylcytosine-specific restriction endonuclease McrA
MENKQTKLISLSIVENTPSCKYNDIHASINKLTNTIEKEKDENSNKSCKNIVIDVHTEKIPMEKKIKEKEIQKRQITNTTKWNFTETELDRENQYEILFDSSKSLFLYQQIKNKLSSYRSQDIEKNIYSIGKFADLSGVLQKMEDCKLKCFYCKECVALLYENVREPKQWTLERIDNKMGHNIDNIEIACLSCNLRRRTMHYERYVLTKNIQKVVKK